MLFSYIIHTLVFLQETAAPHPDVNWLTYLLNGGPFAIVVFFLITDKLTTPGERNRLREETKQLKGQIDELNKEVRTEIVPTLVRANELTKEAMEALKHSGREAQSHDY